MTDLPIIHDREEGVFQIIIDEEIAYLKYLQITGGINIVKTFVPPALEGQGIASQLVEAAFMFAQEHHLKVIPSCSYITTWLKRHPQFSDLIKE